MREERTRRTLLGRVDRLVGLALGLEKHLDARVLGSHRCWCPEAKRGGTNASNRKSHGNKKDWVQVRFAVRFTDYDHVIIYAEMKVTQIDSGPVGRRQKSGKPSAKLTIDIYQTCEGSVVERKLIRRGEQQAQMTLPQQFP